jgi:hypothetical protein
MLGARPKKLHGQSAINQVIFPNFSTIESFEVLISSFIKLRRKQHLGVRLKRSEMVGKLITDLLQSEAKFPSSKRLK